MLFSVKEIGMVCVRLVLLVFLVRMYLVCFVLKLIFFSNVDSGMLVYLV